MKENIFIEGDLVLHNNNVCKIEGKTLTCDTNLLEFYIVRTPNGCLYSIQPIEVIPIPLTSEILERNGWYGATHSKQSDDTTKILYKIFKRKGYPTIKVSQDLKITCELSPFIVKLESVSDLQHLLFGLGINHKIEV